MGYSRSHEHDRRVKPSSLTFFVCSSLVFICYMKLAALSPDPALCATPAHECCSPAPRKFPALPRSRIFPTDRQHQGILWNLEDPPCRSWALRGDRANLQRGNNKMKAPVEVWYLFIKEGGKQAQHDQHIIMYFV